MLFEPGRRSRPARALRLRKMARVHAIRWSASAGRRGPRRARGARLGHQPLEARAVAALDQLAEHRQARAVAIELGQQRFAVLQRDVAPHLRASSRRCA